jgi:hypothetical protein
MPERADAIVNPETRFERSDASPVLIGVLALGIALLVVAAVAGLWLFYPETLRLAPPVALGEFATPRLEVNPRAELQRLEAEWRQRLGGYGWVDRSKGVVHVPIDAAMARIAAQGIPDWPEAKR